MKENWEKIWMFEILADQVGIHQKLILKFLKDSLAQEFIEYQAYKKQGQINEIS